MEEINFKNEREFTVFLKKQLENCELHFSGTKVGTIPYNTKKLKAKITSVDIDKTKVKKGGKCDVKIYHDGLDLSYDHKLSNPFKLELKTNKTWKDSLSQAIRYKYDSEHKYGKTNNGKLIEVGVCTPDLYLYGTFDKTKCPVPNCFHQTGINNSFQKIATCQQFDIKRLFWKTGVALLERNPYNNILKITANEGDQIDVIKKER